MMASQQSRTSNYINHLRIDDIENSLPQISQPYKHLTRTGQRQRRQTTRKNTSTHEEIQKDIYVMQDTIINVHEYSNKILQVPQEPTISQHWCSIFGIQPTIPQNISINDRITIQNMMICAYNNDNDIKSTIHNTLQTDDVKEYILPQQKQQILINSNNTIESFYYPKMITPAIFGETRQVINQIRQQQHQYYQEQEQQEEKKQIIPLWKEISELSIEEQKIFELILEYILGDNDTIDINTINTNNSIYNSKQYTAQYMLQDITLQTIVPYIIQFIPTQIPKYQHTPKMQYNCQLCIDSILHMENQDLVESMQHQILPCIVTCIVTNTIGQRYDIQRSCTVRMYASRILCYILNKYNTKYIDLQSRVYNFQQNLQNNSKTSQQSNYGIICVYLGMYDEYTIDMQLISQLHQLCKSIYSYGWYYNSKCIPWVILNQILCTKPNQPNSIKNILDDIQWDVSPWINQLYNYYTNNDTQQILNDKTYIQDECSVLFYAILLVVGKYLRQNILHWSKSITIDDSTIKKEKKSFEQRKLEQQKRYRMYMSGTSFNSKDTTATVTNASSNNNNTTYNYLKGLETKIREKNNSKSRQPQVNQQQIDLNIVNQKYLDIQQTQKCDWLNDTQLMWYEINSFQGLNQDTIMRTLSIRENFLSQRIQMSKQYYIVALLGIPVSYYYSFQQ